MIGFGILVVLITLLSGLGIYSGSRSTTALREIDRLQDAQALDLQTQLDLLGARMNIWQALATNDPAHWTEAGFAQLHAHLEQLRGSTLDPERLARVSQLADAVTAYEAPPPG